MTRETHSRRQYLRSIGAASAVLGGGSLAASSASAEAQPADADRSANDAGEPIGDVDPADVRLVSKCVDEKRDAAIFCAVNDGAESVTLEWRRAPAEEIEFLDCQTVRVVGDFVDVMAEAGYIADDGEFATDIVSLGPVDGERTFAAGEIDRLHDDAVIATVEAFRDGPVAPGSGDVTASNPEYDACREEFFDGGTGDAIEYVDCQTVRLTGEFADVGIDATFIADDGELGNVVEFFGPVEGERVIDVTENDDVPDDAIAARVDAFEEGTPVVPHGGDVSMDNPDYEACQEDVFGEVVDAGGDSSADAAEESASAAVEREDGDDELPAERAADAGGETSERTEITVPANGKTCFPVAAPDGETTVELLSEGERIDSEDSATDRSCLVPIVPALFDLGPVTIG